MKNPDGKSSTVGILKETKREYLTPNKMTITELIDNLSKLDGKTKFTATFTRIGKNLPLSIFGDSYEYREIFASEDNNIKPITVQEAIDELKTPNVKILL